jgi:hypothetical protein
MTPHAAAILPPIVIGLFLMWKDGVRPAGSGRWRIDDAPAVPASAPPPSRPEAGRGSKCPFCARISRQSRRLAREGTAGS